MIIDCGTCVVRGDACDDCMVSVLLGAPPERLHLGDEEHRALEVLAGSGLVPPLRLVTAAEPGQGRAREPDAGSRATG